MPDMVRRQDDSEGLYDPDGIFQDVVVNGTLVDLSFMPVREVISFSSLE